MSVLQQKPLDSKYAWSFALGTFGVGDVVTTAVGISRGAVEYHPLMQNIIHTQGVGGMLLWKVLVLGGFYFAYKNLDDDYSDGIPIGLGIVGSIVTINNAQVIMETL